MTLDTDLTPYTFPTGCSEKPSFPSVASPSLQPPLLGTSSATEDSGSFIARVLEPSLSFESSASDQRVPHQIAAVDTSSKITTKDLKEKKEVVEEVEDGGDAPANGDTEIEEGGEQEADNEVEEEEDVRKEEKEGDGEEENGEEDEEAQAAEDEEEDADTKKQKTNEDDYTAKKEKLHLTKLNLYTLRFPSQTLNVVTFEGTVLPAAPCGQHHPAGDAAEGAMDLEKPQGDTGGQDELCGSGCPRTEAADKKRKNNEYQQK
ncbi:PREDICTED: myelin transcription factor 1-like [Odobenus rosmarus divergens]|uniref:Prothymosin alpha n=1 Tax=Odobenus rosmarus divergens TaxID=9708 RepID=A0A2U3W083_ODORO|nr:PREDICTED: myelin transcription factor 1-like [Odobenus rosmarus divergens]